jgi:adenine-specific DNA methylase
MDFVKKAEELDKGLNYSFIPIPDYGKGRQGDYGSPRIYGITSFKDFFIPRQRVVFSILGKWINAAYSKMKQNNYDDEEARAITLYLSFALVNFFEFSSRYSVWVTDGIPKQVAGAFSYNLSWDFPEVNPMKEGGFSYRSKIEDIATALDMIAKIKPNLVKVWQHNASQESDIKKESLDLIFTDPPYYGTMDYAGLADFHYGLHRQVISQLYPGLFRDLVTPKSQECILQENKFETLEEAKKAYEKQLFQSFQEMYRVLKPDGILVVVFAHIDLSAWAALISALIDAGFQINASWPINTESTTGAIQGRDALSATMHMVCRKRPNTLPSTTL